MSLLPNIVDHLEGLNARNCVRYIQPKMLCPYFQRDSNDSPASRDLFFGILELPSETAVPFCIHPNAELILVPKSDQGYLKVIMRLHGEMKIYTPQTGTRRLCIPKLTPYAMYQGSRQTGTYHVYGSEKNIETTWQVGIDELIENRHLENEE